MLGVTNTTTSGSSGTVALSNLYINGGGASTVNTQGYVLFCPTARSLVQLGGSSGTVVQDAMRTSRTVYMRGLSEHLRIQTNSPAPWLWRRICFAAKGNAFRTYVSADTPNTTNLSYAELSSGYVRLAINQVVNAAPNTTTVFNSIIFKGSQGVDWNDPILAPVDTARVDLKYDKTRRLTSGNQSGMFKETKLWHPMNKNLTYQDDEYGEQMTSSVFSVDDKRGMGDYYVLDLFSSLLGTSTSDILAVTYQASLYWHEK